MKKILLLGTGGTIACVPSADGLVPALDGAKLLEMVPELQGVCDIDCQEVMNLDSSNLEPADWVTMAKALEASYKNYDGFVVTHGTDTMAYTAAALSWLLRGCKKPVVLTGAQLPMGVEGSDAPSNVLLAFKAACAGELGAKGVMLAFGDKIIHGLYAKKLFSESFAGFDSINRAPLAEVGEKGTLLWNELEGGATEGAEFGISTELETKVAVIKLVPGSSPDILDYYVQQGYKALVLESFGAGGVPNGHNNWLPALERTIKQGVKVVCATQCVYDGVDLTKYPIGVLAQRLGARSAEMLTVEAVVTGLICQKYV